MVYNIIEKEIGSDLLHMYESRPGIVEEIRGKDTWSSLGDLLNEVRSRRHDLFDVPGALDNLVKALDALGPDFSKAAVERDLLHTRVGVSAVREPYKVRLVTKGETFKYYISRFYQKGLWNYLQRFPQFNLTGRPVQHSDFFELLDREKKLEITNFDLWVSGDFSAATDNLKIFYTKLAFDASLNRCNYPEFLVEILKAVIYEQELTYPDFRTTKEKNSGVPNPLPAAKQTTGQLMGSTLSFPILCAVNLVCYWMSLEIYLKRKVQLSELPVLINGDDILFRTDERFYSLWQSVIQEVGFELSMGKNYVHKTFFTINSQGFSWDNQTMQVKDVPYFNIGLLTGQSKLGSSSIKDRSLAPIWDYYNTVIPGAQDPVRAHHRFMHYHKSAISDLTAHGNFNLFISPVLGGLGFNLNPALKPYVHFTFFQRRFGYYLKSMAMHPFEGEYEKFRPFVGLVQPLKSKILSKKYYHYKRIEVRPIVGPLNKNEVIVMDSVKVLEGARMALSYAMSFPGEKPLVVVRPPDSKIMSGFRNSRTIEANPKSLQNFPFRWIEIKEPLPQIVEDQLPPLLEISEDPQSKYDRWSYIIGNYFFDYKTAVSDLTMKD